jgi:hypothetical protein
MAKYSGTWSTVTATAIADAAALTDNNYCYALQGGTSTQRNQISEVWIGGEATTATVVILKLARDSTASATLVAGTGTRVPALLDASGTAPATAPLGGNSAGTDPQRSATLHLLNFSFNAFGGVIRWVANQGYEISMVGNTASLGDLSLSGFTGTGAAATSGHILFETM